MGNQPEKEIHNNKKIKKRNDSNIFMTPKDELDIKINESFNMISDEKVIVGIDFGTSGIGYAYSSKKYKEQIFLCDFEGQSADKKVPSEIILDTDMKEVLAFGAECKKYITNHKKDPYEYFKNIKMNLYKKIYKIKSTNGNECDIEYIITKILEKVSEHALEKIRDSHDKSIEKEDIKWVVSIPAIWEEKSKQIMINASDKAGLINKNTDLSLFLALEPEVAGIYNCSKYSFLNDDHIKNGKPYIICDIGAGTVDICTHRKVMNNNNLELIEEYPPIGGDYGGNYINEEFIKRFIIEIFGEKYVKQLQNDSNNENWDEFERKIEELKKSFDANKPSNQKLDCQIFGDKELEDYISEYNSKNHKYKISKSNNNNKKWELLFSSQIFADITKEISEKIFLKIEEIYNNAHTGYIIMTGAGSKNKNISHYFKVFAKEKKMKIDIIKPAQPEVAIIKGAVLFGFKNNLIKKRKAKYTIGIKCSKDWDENLHKNKGIKKKNKLKGDQCSNLFSKFITINQYVDFDQALSKLYDAIDPNPRIVFYKTLKEDCTFIDEKDENNNLIINEFGNVVFNLGKDYDENNRLIKIDIKLGGTYIVVSAVYLKKKNAIKTIQTFV